MRSTESSIPADSATPDDPSSTPGDPATANDPSPTVGNESGTSAEDRNHVQERESSPAPHVQEPESAPQPPASTPEQNQHPPGTSAAPPEPLKTAVGIDLGVAFCSVAVYVNGRIDVLPCEPDDSLRSPSTIAFTEFERLFGRAAEAQAARNPLNTVTDGVRLLGKKFSDPEICGRDKHVICSVGTELVARVSVSGERGGCELCPSELRGGVNELRRDVPSQKRHSKQKMSCYEMWQRVSFPRTGLPTAIFIT